MCYTLNTKERKKEDGRNLLIAKVPITSKNKRKFQS